jgi:hypothetical protein
MNYIEEFAISRSGYYKSESFQSILSSVFTKKTQPNFILQLFPTIEMQSKY